jgi:hypothetical protein
MIKYTFLFVYGDTRSTQQKIKVTQPILKVAQPILKVAQHILKVAQPILKVAQYILKVAQPVLKMGVKIKYVVKNYTFEMRPSLLSQQNFVQANRNIVHRFTVCLFVCLFPLASAASHGCTAA